eukprot:jgi/Mesvir1/19337/Mv10395-RA.1
MGSLFLACTTLGTLPNYQSPPAFVRSKLALRPHPECLYQSHITRTAPDFAHLRCRSGPPLLKSKKAALHQCGFINSAECSDSLARLRSTTVCNSASPGTRVDGSSVDGGRQAARNMEAAEKEDSRSGQSTAPEDTSQHVELSEDVEKGVDIVILTNGPGELMTWVKATVASLRRRFGNDSSVLRISVLLAPCPHASGKEAEALKSFVGVDRFQEPQHFFQTVLTTQTVDRWRWRKRGVSIFLGGDQLYAIFLGKRLGYRTLLYSEDRCLWPCLADRYVVREEAVRLQVPANWRDRCIVIGDLFLSAVEQSQAVLASDPRGPSPGDGGEGRPLGEPAEGEAVAAVARAQDVTGVAVAEGMGERAATKRGAGGVHAPLIVGILPGSKAAKLRLGVPYMVGVADELSERVPNVCFVMPLPLTVGLDELAGYGDVSCNEMIGRFGWASCRLVAGGSTHGASTAHGSSTTTNGSTTGGSGASAPPGRPTTDRDAAASAQGLDGPLAVATAGRPTATLETSRGTRVHVYQTSPPYGIYQQCDLCLTTVGTNTAELGSLGVPMVVMLPTHALEVFQGGAGGLAGLLCSIPGPVGAFFTRAVNAAVLKAAGHMAWPNRWAGKEVVPELVGRLEPEEVAVTTAKYLQEPVLLYEMRATLLALEGGRAARAMTTDGSRGTMQPDAAASDLLAEEVMQLLMAPPA